MKLVDFGSCSIAAVDINMTMIGTPFWSTCSHAPYSLAMNAQMTPLLSRSCGYIFIGLVVQDRLTVLPVQWRPRSSPSR